jgi:hypothetical protein
VRDRRLEKNIERVEAFIERWKELSQYLDRGFKREPFTPEEEAGFLNLKSAIAQEHEVLQTTISGGTDRDDKAMRLLNSVPSLQSFRDLPEGMAHKIAAEWHSTYMGLHSLLGRLQGRKIQLASISSFGMGMQRVFGNPLVVTLIALAACYGVYKVAQEVIPAVVRFQTELTAKQQTAREHREQKTGEKRP